jgi:solute carrier family 41
MDSVPLISIDDETGAVRSSELDLSDEDDCVANGRLPSVLKIDSEVPDDARETPCRIATQVFLPFLIAGFGTVLAGMLLDAVQHWSVFINVTELFILVPALLGLKGNLEMTLASRLSTAVSQFNLKIGEKVTVIKFKINLIITQSADN